MVRHTMCDTMWLCVERSLRFSFCLCLWSSVFLCLWSSVFLFLWSSVFLCLWSSVFLCLWSSVFLFCDQVSFCVCDQVSFCVCDQVSFCVCDQVSFCVCDQVSFSSNVWFIRKLRENKFSQVYQLDRYKNSNLSKRSLMQLAAFAVMSHGLGSCTFSSSSSSSSPWIRSFDLFRHRRIAIISWGVHYLFFLEVCSWGRVSGVWCCPVLYLSLTSYIPELVPFL